MRQGDLLWAEDERIGGYRPVLVVSRTSIIPHVNWIIVAPVTRRRRGIASELDVGVANGLAQASVVQLDAMTLIDKNVLARPIGELAVDDLNAMYEAIRAVFDLP